MKLKSLSTFVVIFSIATLTSITGHAYLSAQVTLSNQLCGEIDPYVIGDACGYDAVDINTNEYYRIYDSLGEDKSALADWNKDHNLVDGNNCFEIKIYQTIHLVERFGEEAYFTASVEKIQCK